MKKLQVLIVDDQGAVAESAAESLRATVGDDCEVTVLPLDRTKKEIDVLFSRYKKSVIEGGDLAKVKISLPSTFDEMDVLVLDYDLNEMSTEDGEWASGLEVARMARAFSSASTIVLLNQFKANRFDLTMTEGTGSWADLDVSRIQLSNPGLWSSRTFEGFRPWRWPDLLEEPARFEALVGWIGQRMDKPVLSSIQLNADGASDDDSRAVVREAWTMLKIDPIEGTFRNLVEESGCLPSEAHNKALAVDALAAPRVAAALLRRWIERVVVPMQDILVDAPHLAYLMPWLLKRPDHRESWNETCALRQADASFSVSLENVRLEPPWLASRTVYFYRTMQDDPRFARPRQEVEPLDLHFCEDTSAFEDSGSVRSFSTLLPGSYTVRHVSDPEAAHDERDGPQDTSKVSYLPQTFFAL